MADKYYIKDGKAYSDEQHSQEDSEATEVLQSVKGYSSIFELESPEKIEFVNQLTEEESDKLENEVNSFIQSNGLQPNITHTQIYTLDESLIPENMSGATPSSDNITIERNPILIHVEKDAQGKNQYTKYIKNNEGNFEKNTDNWDPKAPENYGSAEVGKITINDFIFLGDEDVLRSVNNEIEDKTSPENKNQTIEHEIQHIVNQHKLKQLSDNKLQETQNKEGLRVSIKDYYRLCYYDEIIATLAPIVKTLSKENTENNHPSRQDWFYDQYKDQSLPDIKSPEGQKAILKSVIEHWNKEKASIYATSNGQLIKQTQDYALTHPWGSYAQDNSSDYQQALKAMLSDVSGIDFGEALNQELPDPVKEHQNYMKVSDQENPLDKLEMEAEAERQKRARYGYSEDFERQYLANPEESYVTAPFDYKPLINNEEKIDDEQRNFYHTFFQKVAARDKLGYQEDEQSPNYTVDLVRYTNPEAADEEKQVDNTTHISIKSDNSVVMTATKPDGSKIVPDQQRFNDLAELAHQKGIAINFGNITTPEYAARLYLACISHNPPIKMNGAPDIEQLKNDISPNTLDAINAVQNHPSQQEIQKHYHDVKEKLNMQKNTKQETNDYYNFCQEYDKNNLSAYAQKNNLKLIKTENGSIKMIGDAEAQKQYVIARRNAYINQIDNSSNYNPQQKKDTKDGKQVSVNFYEQIKQARNKVK